ncbi:MAG: trypsin-like serine protease [Pseudobdellovibrionaceae bacterium]|nr:trypsin-like serine protease [Pseudobdellovibrionaceae bacterium]
MSVSITRWTLLSGFIVSVSWGCGQPATDTSDLMIRGGQEVKADDQSIVRRSTVALTTDFVKDKATTPSLLDEGHSFCSGTIVGPRLIVTAAHCVQELINNKDKGGTLLPKAENFVVHFDAKISANGTYIRAEKVIPHPDWNPSQTLSPFPFSKPNDIGVVILSEDIPDSMLPVKIADPGIAVNGKTAVLAGFGITKDRNTNDTGILRTIASTFSAENGKIARVTHGTWFKGICAGDSGGPAYFEVDGELQLVGAASTGAEIPFLGCAGTNSNSTDIRYYKDWIQSVSP